MAIPLHDAVSADDPGLVRQLLAEGSDVNEPNSVGHTPIFLAKSVPVAELLLEGGASLEVESDKGYTPLMGTAVTSPAHVVAYLVTRGADVTAANGKNGFTPLHYLAWSEGREDLAAQMIDAGAEVNARNKNLQTPLHIAAGNRIHALTQLYLARGADPNALDEEGLTPFMRALFNFGVIAPDLPYLELFFEDTRFDPNAHGETGLGAMHLAASRNVMDSIVERLLALGADLDAPAHLPGHDVAGFTPLHAAAWLGMEETTALLLRSGADAGARTSDGRTALHWVVSPLRVQLHDTHLVGQLVGINDTHQPRMDGGRYPRYAYLRKHGLPAARMLMQNGAQLDPRDEQGRTPLHQAREAGYQEVADYLAALAEGRDVPPATSIAKAAFGEEFTLAKGEAVEFENGLTVRFVRHSLDSIMLGGYNNPLKVWMEYEEGGNKETQTHEAYPDNHKPWGWNWGGFEFQVRDFEFQSFIKLSVSPALPERPRRARPRG